MNAGAYIHWARSLSYWIGEAKYYRDTKKDRARMRRAAIRFRIALAELMSNGQTPPRLFRELHSLPEFYVE